MKDMALRALWTASLAAIWALAAPAAAQDLPTGQTLTPLAAPGAHFEPLTARTGPHPETVADGAAAVALSPNGQEMLILTSGYNLYYGADAALVPAQSGQYIFRYRITSSGPRHVQTVTVPNSFSGIAWAPDGNSFHVGGGVDDKVYSFTRDKGLFSPFGDGIALGHKAGNGIDVLPQAAGVAVSPDGTRLLVANYYNDSVTLIDLATRKIIGELDLRPGRIDPAKAGVPGGEFPFAVVWRGNDRAYVSAPRDREIVALAIAGNAITVASRIHTLGEPTALHLDGAAQRLYAAQDNADRLAIVDTASDRMIAEPQLRLPEGMDPVEAGKGFNPNSVAAGPQGTLLVTYGGINALAMVQPADGATKVLGLVPTGWYPSAAAASRDGKRLFVVNRKSPPGANPRFCGPKVAVRKGPPDVCGAGANQFVFQLEKAGLLSLPSPSPRTLLATTRQVAANIHLGDTETRARAEAVMAQLRQRIRHVVYIVKENRSYDQVLGDLEIGNGDPSLTLFPKTIAPNHHALASQFVTLDNFYDSGEQSSTGWTWTTAGRTTDLLEKTAPVNYSRRGLAYEAEQVDRNIAAQLPLAERRKARPALPNDPDLLAGPAMVTAPDGDADDQQGQGFIWHAALRAKLTLRNYGFFNATVYADDKPGDVPPIRDPFGDRYKVFASADPVLAPLSDPWYRGFDQRLPDYWRLKEWQREFAAQVAANDMPALTLLRLAHDHFGSFATAIDGVDTVETQMADNDYALGAMIETIAKSPFAKETLVFVIEDDAQNGADHVDARRSLAYVVGPYVKQHALVSSRYNTVNMLRTIEAVLGLKPMGLNDALAVPMSDLFDLNQTQWSYTATASPLLRQTKLPIPAAAFGGQVAMHACPLRTPAYWAQAMQGQDFSSEDRLDTDRFNAALWAGLGRGGEPRLHTGADLREGRDSLLAGAARTAGCPN